MSTETKKQKNGAVLKKCKCLNEVQDSMYGKSVRVMNLCKDGDKARCTVCGIEQ